MLARTYTRGMVMLSRIDSESVHRICSGQVVLSLAIAVKELIENSLDAGATNIEVKLKEFGSELLEVSDNGTGVHPDNFQSLTLKHYTSKISQFSEVATVDTFGFRGEALSSLCALGNVAIFTCHGSQTVGCHLEYDHNGLIKTKTNCAREVGTTVSISNLFCTLPVRQKEFHRNLKKEYGKLIQMLQGYCLIVNQVKITCYNQTGKSKRQLVLINSGSSQIIDNVSCVFGPKQTETLVPIVQCSPISCGEDEESFDDEVYSNFQLAGYVSKCIHGCGRSSTDRQFFFINGRPCDHSKLSKIVNEVYHMFNKHQYPCIVLNIVTAQKELVDVNVTPDKRQVMLQQEKALLVLVKNSLMKIFEPMQKHITIAPTPPLTPTQGTPSTPSFFTKPSPSVHGTKRTANNHTEGQPKLKQPCLKEFGLVTQTTHQITSPTIINRQEDNPVISTSTDNPVISTSTDNPVISTSTDNPVISTSTDNPVISTGTDNPVTDIPVISTSTDNPVTITSTDNPVISTNTDNPVITINTESPDVNKSSTVTTPLCNRLVVPLTTPLSLVNKSSSVIKSPLCDRPTSSKNSSPHSLEQPIVYDTDHSNVKDSTSKHCVSIDIDQIATRLKMMDQSQPLSSKGEKRRYFHAKIQPESNHDAEDELKRELNKEDFSHMEILGQFNKGFIIAKLGSDLFIIDQHATDEKFNFERLKRETIIEHQSLIHPLPLELTAVGESVINDNLDVFEKNGFRFSINNDAPPTKRVSLIGQPVSKNWSMGVPEIEELIFLLTDFPGEMVRPACVTKMLASRSCRSSIMIGTALNIKDMTKLVTHMSEMDQPWNCPHGRPTIRHLVDLSKITVTDD